MMEVKVLSRETIIPSCGTPPHLKTFQLSLLDQLSPMIYIPLLFFYPMKKDSDDIGHHNNPKKAIAKLKKSLSETLSCFSFLAGRIIEKSICCNDKGAIFTEASVGCNMCEILKEPNNEVLMKLLPCSILCSSDEAVEGYAQVVVQANIFNCGGIAISLCLLHKLMDGTTFSCFLRSWASINKLGSFESCRLKMECSDYKAFSSLFPQTNSLPFHPKIQGSCSDRKRCLRRFVFRGKAILDLKAKAKCSEVPNPTCVEAVTGFVWKHALEAAASTKSTDSQRLRLSTLSHVVNLRKRMEPPLPEVSVGNILWGAVAHFSANEEIEVDQLSKFVSLLRHSFAKVNSDYIKGLMGNEGIGAVLKLISEVNEAPNYYFCTSWRNLNLKEVDFGWGKPVWIGIAGELNEVLTNIIVLLDCVSGDGVEVWMILDQKEMDLLQQNPKFLEFALLNPSIDLP